MWETIHDVLISPNVTIVLVFVAFVAVIGWFLTKSGFLSVHTDNVSLGAANKEREIIRQQVEWVRLHFEAMEAQLNKDEDYDSWRGRYVAERLFDEYVNWITFNHLNMSSAYVEIKQDKVVNLVRSLTIKDEYHSEEFEQMLRDDTKNSIEKLIQIRNVYK